jgi:fused signal recognition particle receptor
VIFKATLERLKTGLSKTKANFADRIAGAVGLHRKIDDQLLSELEEILIQADVGVGTSQRILENLKQRASREKTEGSDKVTGILKEEIKEILTQSGAESETGVGFPLVIMIIGVNGTGKTTSIGKLAYRFKQNGKRVAIAACDTFRAAAIDQLEIWAQRAGAEFIKSQPEADPAAVAFDAVQAGLARKIDVVIIDTAGRLHTKLNLMEELKKIRRVISKLDPAFPQEILLVLDSTTGQNAISQVRLFQEAVQPTGLILAKLDGTAKGGVVIAIADQLRVPVRYIGVGEKIEDLEEFLPDEFIEALFS